MLDCVQWSRKGHRACNWRGVACAPTPRTYVSYGVRLASYWVFVDRGIVGVSSPGIVAVTTIGSRCRRRRSRRRRASRRKRPPVQAGVAEEGDACSHRCQPMVASAALPCARRSQDARLRRSALGGVRLKPMPTFMGIDDAWSSGEVSVPWGLVFRMGGRYSGTRAFCRCLPFATLSHSYSRALMSHSVLLMCRLEPRDAFLRARIESPTGVA